MSSVNSVVVSGNLTRDPEIKYVPSGASVCTFGIAVSNKYKDKEDVVFLDVTAWGRTGEVVNEYAAKGSRLIIEGSLKQESWEDKSGNKRSKIVLVASRVHLPPKSESRAGNDDGNSSECDAAPF